MKLNLKLNKLSIISISLIMLLGACSARSKVIKPLDPASSMQEVKAAKTSLDDLNSLYITATGKDSTKVAFSGPEGSKFIKTYTTYLYDFEKYAENQGMKWNGPKQITHYFYFDKDGNIDLVIFEFVSKIDDELELKYKTLLTEYTSSHPIGAKAEVPFRHSSPIIFR